MSDNIETPNDFSSEPVTGTETTTIDSGPAILPAQPNPKRNWVPWLLALNLLSLAGVVILFGMLRHGGRGNDQIRVDNALTKSGNTRLAIAYVNNDSILESYDLVKKMKSELEQKGKRLEAEVAAKQRTFEKDAAYLQEQVQKKTISEQSAQEIYGQLMQSQQNINALREKYMADMQKSEADMNIALLDSVMNFLKRYNAKFKFDYILGYNKVGSILYANDTLDITNNVIEELNAEYHRKNGK